MKATFASLVGIIKRKMHHVAATSLARALIQADGQELPYSDLVTLITGADRDLYADAIEEFIDVLELEGVLVPVNLHSSDEIADKYQVNVAAVVNEIKRSRTK